MKTIKRIYSWYCKIENVACGVGIISLVLLVLLAVVFRAIKVSMSWYADLAKLLLAWTAFLGADVAWRSGQIIGVDLFTRNLPNKIQNIIKLLIYLVVLAAIGLISYYGVVLIWSERVSEIESLHIPTGIVTLSLVMATFSMFFSTIGKIWNAVLGIAGKNFSHIETEKISVDSEESLNNKEEN